MISYTFNKEEWIFYVKRQGVVTFEDIMNHIIELDSNYRDLKRLYLLTDARKAEVTYSEDDFPLFIDKLKEGMYRYDEVKEAIIVDTPAATAYSSLFSELSNTITNYSYKVFSTLEGAKNWLMYNKNRKIIPKT